MADDQQQGPEAMGMSEEAGRRHRLLDLEFGKSGDFDDPSQEWRRLFSELLGTFFLVLVGAGAVDQGPQRQLRVSAERDGAANRPPRRVVRIP